MHLLHGNYPPFYQVAEAASHRYTATTAVKLLTIDGLTCIMSCNNASDSWLKTRLIPLAQYLIEDTFWKSLNALFLGLGLQPIPICLCLFLNTVDSF